MLKNENKTVAIMQILGFILTGLAAVTTVVASGMQTKDGVTKFNLNFGKKKG